MRRRPRRRRKVKPRRARGRTYYRLVIFLCIMALIGLLVIKIDRYAFPKIIEITDIKAKNKINTVLNRSVQDITGIMGIDATDFYNKTTDANGKIQDISINTILVNDFCARLAQQLSDDLVNMGAETVSLPIGSLGNISFLSNVGPKYTVSVMPMGDAHVDYDCSFEAAGINQINFQVWLTVNSTVKVVNPLQSHDIAITRRVALVNTMISGEVPETYLNGLGIK